MVNLYVYANQNGCTLQSKWVYTPIKMGVYINQNGCNPIKMDVVQSKWVYTPIKMGVQSNQNGCILKSKWIYSPIKISTYSNQNGCTLQSKWVQSNQNECSPIKMKYTPIKTGVHKRKNYFFFISGHFYFNLVHCSKTIVLLFNQ